MKIEQISIKEIKVNLENPRIINSKKFKKLVKSVKEFPDMLQLRPIIVNDEMVILGGNMRFKACQEAGMKNIPIIRASNLTVDQQKEFIIKDNVSFGQWDEDMINLNWSKVDLSNWGVDIEKTKRKKKLSEDNHKIVSNIETNIKLGDVIKIGEHVLICGDSTNKSTYKKLLDGGKADMMLTDPPYNVDYVGSGKAKLKIINDKQTDADFKVFLKSFHAASYPHIKDGGAVYVWHADSEGYNFRTAFLECGLLMKQCLIWVKSSLVLGRQDYQWIHEPCLYGWKPGASHYFTHDRTLTTVIEEKVDIKKLKVGELRDILTKMHDQEYGESVLRFDKPLRNPDHPTMKPILLFGELIENSSREGEIIMDPFGGSGSTMVAAHQSGRVARLIELDPKYCQAIVNRMKALDPDIKIDMNYGK